MIIRQVAAVGVMVLERMKKVEIVFGSNVLNGKVETAVVVLGVVSAVGPGSSVVSC